MSVTSLLATLRKYPHPPIRAIFQEYARSLGFEEICVSVPARTAAVATCADPSLTLPQLKLVDTATADWRQIIELRKDKESHQRLIRLRLFMHSNYTGRPFAFIEDDLARRIHEYEAAARKHGFKTVVSSLTVLLNAKELQASLGAGLVAGLFGGPLAALGTGLAVEVGQIAVHVADRLHEMRDWRSGHELAYSSKRKQNSPVASDVQPIIRGDLRKKPRRRLNFTLLNVRFPNSPSTALGRKKSARSHPR